MKLWVGPEMEGEFMGCKTLFVGSPSIHHDRIDEVLKDYDDIKQIYFGAGGCTKINTHTLRRTIDKHKDIIITAEVDIEHLHDYSYGIFKDTNLIVTINHKNFGLLDFVNKDTAQIKLQSLGHQFQRNILTVGKLKEFTETNLGLLTGKKYKDDEVIE